MPSPITSRTKRERRTNAVIATLTVLAIPAILALCIWLLVTVPFSSGEGVDCDAPPAAGSEGGRHGHRSPAEADTEECLSFDAFRGID